MIVRKLGYGQTGSCNFEFWNKETQQITQCGKEGVAAIWEGTGRKYVCQEHLDYIQSIHPSWILEPSRRF